MYSSCQFIPFLLIVGQPWLWLLQRPVVGQPWSWLLQRPVVGRPWSWLLQRPVVSQRWLWLLQRPVVDQPWSWLLQRPAPGPGSKSGQLCPGWQRALGSQPAVANCCACSGCFKCLAVTENSTPLVRKANYSCFSAATDSFCASQPDAFSDIWI